MSSGECSRALIRAGPGQGGLWAMGGSAAKRYGLKQRCRRVVWMSNHPLVTL